MPGGAGAATQSDPESEKIATDFAKLLETGDFTKVADMISSKAIGDLKKMKEGTIDEKLSEKLKAAFAGAKKANSGKSGTETSVGFENSKGEKIQIIVAKEGDKRLVKKLTVRKK